MKKQYPKKVYPKMDLGRKRGLPFVMAFVYSPGGTVVFTGDLGTIRDYLRNGPTCHGTVTYYAGHFRIPQSAVEVFGKGSYEFRKKNYLSISHISLHDANKPYALMRTQALKPYLDERKKFVLVEHFGNTEHVLGKWRKLPKTYLSVFKEYDATGV